MFSNSILFICFIYCVGSVFSVPVSSVDRSRDDKLLFANVIFRHGDRTPIRFYPTDPHKNNPYWSDGLGQLTNVGKRRAYELGEWLRQRYDYLLTPSYNRSKFYINSRDLDRCLMSAETVLAAIYPPKTHQQWLKNLDWQPIPVHMTPKKYDRIFEFHHCPVYQEEFKNLMYSEEIQELDKQFADVYSILDKHSGKIHNSLKDIADVYDTLKIEKEHNLTIPEWTENIFPERLKEAQKYSFSLPVWTPQLGRLRSGLLLKDMVHNIKRKLKNSGRKDYNLVMYSASDSTIVHLLRTLQLIDLDIPPYSAAVLMELTEGDGGDHHVSMFYRNSTHHEPHRLILPGCTSSCPIDQFLNITAQVIPVDWDKECGLKNKFLPDPDVQEEDPRLRAYYD